MRKLPLFESSNGRDIIQAELDNFNKVHDSLLFIKDIMVPSAAQKTLMGKLQLILGDRSMEIVGASAETDIRSNEVTHSVTLKIMAPDIKVTNNEVVGMVAYSAYTTELNSKGIGMLVTDIKETNGITTLFVVVDYLHTRLMLRDNVR